MEKILHYWIESLGNFIRNINYDLHTQKEKAVNVRH